MSHAFDTSLPDNPLRDLTPAQRAWALESERLWRRAHEIANRHPDSDASDLYHALRALQLTPTQRLAAGLRRGRLRTHVR
jgi:hypothetical protein